ncbi:MAG: spore gernimation protein [Candidatus Syntrophonatronum acetioxidans]|uniref:Spore gernimation protein n=1 Tax=Candidatus Syntrophonatronum acetioxidans TaxID=1795816 RepID=A0A424YG23_9FIRM|nr:MAG: spore gernimation protein [Candidatus Syntrophonatronum acetioxidans]
MISFGEKISTRQATLLMATTILATAILFLPAITTEQAREDAWISTLIALVNGLLISLLVITLMKRFPRQTIIQYSEVILGKVLGKVIGLGYIWFFLHTNAIIVREFGAFMATAFMPNTPLIIFNGLIVVLAILVVRSGLEPLARLNEWIFIVTGFFFVVIAMFVISEMNLENLRPFLERGIMPSLKGAITPTSWFGEIIILAMIFPFLSRPQKGYRIGAGAVLIAGAFLFTGLLQAVSIFGPELVKRFDFPILEVVRLISLGDFFERIDALVMAIWVGGVFVKTSVFHFATVTAAAQWFNLEEYNPLAIPLGLLTVILSIHLFEGAADLVKFLSETFPFYALSLFEVGIPALLLVTAFIRNKGGPSL